MERPSYFRDATTPVEFWTIVKNAGMSLDDIAVNLNALKDARQIISWILDSRSDQIIKNARSQLFNQCVRRRYHREVELLLNQPNVDPATKANVALLTAVENMDTRMVSILLKDERVDPTDRKFEIIHRAVEMGYPSILTQLIFHEKSLKKLSEDDVRHMRDGTTYGTAIWDILTRVIKLKSEVKGGERMFKRTKDPIEIN